MNNAENQVRGRLQKLRGKVIQNKLDRTITVEVTRKFQHPIYKKVISRRKRYLVDDRHNAAQINDVVTIAATRRLSTLKRFRLFKIVHSSTDLVKNNKMTGEKNGSTGN